MKPYGGERAQLARARHSADNNRKRKTHREALDAEERAAKRKARTEGEAEIREAVACMAAAGTGVPE